MSKHYLEYPVTDADRREARARTRGAKPGKARDDSAYLNALGVITARNVLPDVTPQVAAILLNDVSFAVRTTARGFRPPPTYCTNVNAGDFMQMRNPSIIFVSYSDEDHESMAYLLGFMPIIRDTSATQRCSAFTSTSYTSRIC